MSNGFYSKFKDDTKFNTRYLMERLSSDVIQYLRENPHVETMSNQTFVEKINKCKNAKRKK